MNDANPRSCSRCGAALSRYNPSAWCAKCSRSSPELPADFWASEPMSQALSRWDVGALVRAYRQFTGVSQKSVATLVSIDQSEVSRLERGRKLIRDRRQVLTWTRALGIPDTGIPDLPTGPIRNQAGTVLSSVAGPPATSRDEAGRPLRVEAVDEFVVQLQYRDNQLGGDALLAEAEHHLHDVVALLSAAHASADEKLLQNAAAQLAQMTGWLSLDAGRPVDARRNLTTALYAAHMAGDSALASSVLGYLSLTALYHGSPAEALALGRTAHDTTAATGRTNAMLATRLARALAENGHRPETRATLHAAERNFSRTEAHSNSPVWLTYFDEGELLAQQGICLMKIGALDEARTCLGSALQHLRTSGTNNLRDQVHYLIRLADIALLDGDLDEACSQAQEAVVLNERISSTRMSRNIADFVTRLQSRQTVRSVRQFIDQAAIQGTGADKHY